MSGINYDLRKIKAFAFDVDGVLSPSTIPVSPTGDPMRMANIKDGYALQLAVKKGYRIVIITGAKTESVRHRYNSLGITEVFLGAQHKLEIFESWIENNGLSTEEVLYMGDDIPDLKCLALAGLACCPADACAEVRASSNYISRFDGGYGCCRDVIEQVLKANNHWLNDADAFGW